MILQTAPCILTRRAIAHRLQPLLVMNRQKACQPLGEKKGRAREGRRSAMHPTHTVVTPWCDGGQRACQQSTERRTALARARGCQGLPGGPAAYPSEH
jgi:hypothetical protein